MPSQHWIFDTVSLSNFLRADAVGVLRRRYARKAILSWEVYDELLRGTAKIPELAGIHALVDRSGFSLVTMSQVEREFYVDLTSTLGAGEASCIAIARFRGCTVVTDDRGARKRCAQLKLSVTGTIGILKACCLDASLDIGEADAIFARMVGAGFYSPVRSIAELV